MRFSLHKYTRVEELSTAETDATSLCLLFGRKRAHELATCSKFSPPYKGYSTLSKVSDNVSFVQC